MTLPLLYSLCRKYPEHRFAFVSRERFGQFFINKPENLELLTFAQADGKHVFWHTASHILAQAVKRLYPETKLAIGPAIDNGFYYDFDSASSTAAIPTT